MKSEIQKQYGAQEAGRSSLHEVLERAEQPQAGDKYIRADRRMTVEVTGVADNRISIECVDDGVCENRVWPLSTFQMLARKSIEFGAKFEAARSNEKLRHSAGKTESARKEKDE